MHSPVLAKPIKFLGLSYHSFPVNVYLTSEVVFTKK